MEISLSYILRRLVRFMQPALWRQSSRAAEHSAGHVILRSAARGIIILVKAVKGDEQRIVCVEGMLEGTATIHVGNNKSISGLGWSERSMLKTSLVSIARLTSGLATASCTLTLTMARINTMVGSFFATAGRIL
jgi:hypothetical protein